ncbi:MAG: hypothetical protein QM790_02575 [Nibricoccus sp.]
MISLLFKPYRGGPLFGRLSSHCFDLEGTSLEFTVPASSWVMKEAPRSLNYPFRTDGWFGSHCRRSNVREYISVFFEAWHYCPRGLERIIKLLAMGANDPIACLWFSVHLNRTEKGRKIDLTDAQSLGAYIKWEYDDYYESPEQGPYGKGRNFRVRSECDAKYVKDPYRANDPFFQQQHQAALRNYLEPMPQDFALTTFGNAQWTYFSRKLKVNGSWCDHYCLPLSESYYLEIELKFKFETGIKKRNAIIKADMQRTADSILQHIKVSRAAGVSSPLSLPASPT